jgi:hypothetical protein
VKGPQAVPSLRYSTALKQQVLDALIANVGQTDIVLNVVDTLKGLSFCESDIIGACDELAGHFVIQILEGQHAKIFRKTLPADL